jgi:hypothetical protein
MTKYPIFPILIAAFLASTAVIISNTTYHASAAFSTSKLNLVADSCFTTNIELG